ncbi:hypothetical protein CCACVL1_19931, partial [Corchorus capsularis]
EVAYQSTSKGEEETRLKKRMMKKSIALIFPLLFMFLSLAPLCSSRGIKLCPVELKIGGTCGPNGAMDCFAEIDASNLVGLVLFDIKKAEDPYRFYNWNITCGDIFPSLFANRGGVL